MTIEVKPLAEVTLPQRAPGKGHTERRSALVNLVPGNVITELVDGLAERQRVQSTWTRIGRSLGRPVTTWTEGNSVFVALLSDIRAAR